MGRFEDQLSRMQSLMTYGMVTESKNNGSIEYHKIASDGKAYGIIKECSKYYIKSAPSEKETIAEAYDYLGGWNNRKEHEYDSYAKALKQFDLKMMSINEACGAKTNAVSLDPSKKQELVIEGTDKMKAELARQRQIMNNTLTIIREGSYIGVGDPEKVAGKNDKNAPYTQKGEAKLDKDMPKANCAPSKESTPYGNGKAMENGKDVKSSDVLSKGEAVAAQHPSGGKVARVNESCEDGGCAHGIHDWETGLNKGNGDAKSVKWVDGATEPQGLNEEEINGARDWNAGLPGAPGTGDPHGEEPFNKPITENEDLIGTEVDPMTNPNTSNQAGDMTMIDEEGEDGEEPEIMDDENDDDAIVDNDVENLDTDTEGDEAIEDDGDEDGIENDEPIEDGELEDELEGEDDENADLEDEIAELRAEIEALKAELGGENDEVDDEDDEQEYDLELDGDEEGEEYNPNLGNEDAEDYSEPMEDEGEEEGFEDEEDMDECDLYEGRKDDAWKKQMNFLFGNEYGPFGSKENFNKAVDALAQKEMGKKKSCKNGECKNESKQAYMNSIVESVVRELRGLNEERTELHDFGKHPGYRKKPMTLPTTGSDNENGMRDWNDDSVHSEAPFGQSKGDSKPYKDVVEKITNSVMESFKKKA